MKKSRNHEPQNGMTKQSNLAYNYSPSLGEHTANNLETFKTRVQEEFPSATLFEINGYYQVKIDVVFIAQEIFPPETSDPETAWFHAQAALENEDIVYRLRRDIEFGYDEVFEDPERAINSFI